MPVKCWKDTIEERLFNIDAQTDSKGVALISYEDCDDDLYTNKEFCRDKCNENEKECNSFCSKTNCDSKSIEDFRYKNFFRSFNHIYSRKVLMNQKCPDSYVECDYRSCAISKEFCGLQPPKFSKKFVDAFANFMGYVQSITEGKVFAWTDESK
jgi:hypothetical protein